MAWNPQHMVGSVRIGTPDDYVMRFLPGILSRFAQSFPLMASGLGLATSYTFYAVCAVISYFLVKRYIHETKGRELEQMEG